METKFKVLICTRSTDISDSDSVMKNVKRSIARVLGQSKKYDGIVVESDIKKTVELVKAGAVRYMLFTRNFFKNQNAQQIAQCLNFFQEKVRRVVYLADFNNTEENQTVFSEKFYNFLYIDEVNPESMLHLLKNGRTMSEAYAYCGLEEDSEEEMNEEETEIENLFSEEPEQDNEEHPSEQELAGEHTLKEEVDCAETEECLEEESTEAIEEEEIPQENTSEPDEFLSGNANNFAPWTAMEADDASYTYPETCNDDKDDFSDEMEDEFLEEQSSDMEKPDECENEPEKKDEDDLRKNIIEKKEIHDVIKECMNQIDETKELAERTVEVPSTMEIFVDKIQEIVLLKKDINRLNERVNQLETELIAGIVNALVPSRKE